MRRSQPRPSLGPRTCATRMPQGGNEFPWWKEANLFDACASSANAENKTPPGLATRGRSRFLGRSGWPISQGVSRMSGVQAPCGFAAGLGSEGIRMHAQAAARWLQIKRVGDVVRGLHGMWSGEKTAAGAEGRARYAGCFVRATHFSLCFSLPTGGVGNGCQWPAGRMVASLPVACRPWPPDSPIPRSTR